jgi:hypothetical protein
MMTAPRLKLYSQLGFFASLLLRPHMRFLGIISATVLCSLIFASDSRLSPGFRTVYILEMTDALDQHLANRISSGHVLWVVLDPASADAVLTDSVDGAFWTWMQRTYSPTAGAAGTGHSGDGTTVRDVPLGTSHRGTVFLVDPRKRLVLWSTHEPPRDTSPVELDRTAARIANELKAALSKK